MDIRILELPIFLPAGDEGQRCIGRLQESLTQITGVMDAAIANSHDTIRIVYDPNLVTFSRIEGEARRLGAEIMAQIYHVTFALERLDCPENARNIEHAVSALEGVLWAGANFATARIHVEFERGKTHVREIARCIRAFGVRPTCLDRLPVASEPDRRTDAQAEIAKEAAARARKPYFPFLGERSGQAFTGALLAACGLMTQNWEVAADNGARISLWFFAAALVIGGWGTLRCALGSLRARVVDTSVLLTLAVMGAVCLGAWEEAVGVVLVYGLCMTLQERILNRARGALRSLLNLMPPQATVKRDVLEETKPSAHVLIGDTIIVRSGERIPLDGVVTQGSGMVNEAPVTGESTPIAKNEGDSVYAGALNGQETLEIRVTHSARDATLARLVHCAEEAQAQRAPTEQRIERFARACTPLILCLAVAVAVAPPLMMSGDFSWFFADWLHRALSLLLIASCGSLLLATPVAMATALMTAARRGVLIKGGVHLETVGTVKAIVYDKTGALTEAVASVEDVVSFSNMACAEALAVAAAIEGGSEHPLALAICQEAARRHLHRPYRLAGVVELPGRGLRAKVNDTTYILGSQKFFETQKVVMTTAGRQALAEADRAGLTSVLLGSGSLLHALILLREKPRSEAHSVIARLHRMGILYQAMLSGDNSTSAARIAAEVGLEEFEGGLLPEKKLRTIRRLQHRYGRVAMVGDSVNDVNVLAAADVGMAIGAADSKAALGIADVALMRDGVARLPFVIHISRRTRAIVRQNVGCALLVKATLLMGAIMASLPLWVAILGEMGAALLVTFNAQRLVSGPDVEAAPDAEPEVVAPLLELVFINDKTVDENPEAGHDYPVWERFAVPFTGAPVRFGRKSPTSALPVQIEDAGMSRVHGEVRLEGGQPVIVDLHSTNGIRYNGRSAGALIPSERPTPLRIGDNLMIGRNTRIEVRRPGDFGAGPRLSLPAHAVNGDARVSAGVRAVVCESDTQDLRGKSGTPTSC